MKTHFLLLAALIIIGSCSKENQDPVTNDDCSKGPSTQLHIESGIIVYIDLEDWYLEENDIGGGSIHLHISGSVDADSLTIRTYGDGLIIDSPAELNANGEFNEDICISFTATSIPEGDINTETYITIYKSPDEPVEFLLESCTLRY